MRLHPFRNFNERWFFLFFRYGTLAYLKAQRWQPLHLRAFSQGKDVTGNLCAKKFPCHDDTIEANLLNAPSNRLHLPYNTS